MSYAGGTWYADDARRVHLGDFPWRVNDKFTYTYDFGDYWQHQVRVEKVLPATTVLTVPVCVGGRRACPPEDVGGPRGYDQRTLDQFSWAHEAHDRVLAGEDIREDDVPTWFWTYRPEHFDKDHVNPKLAKLYQLKDNPDFLYSQGGYDYFFRGFRILKTVSTKPDDLLDTAAIALRHATGRHLCQSLQEGAGLPAAGGRPARHGPKSGRAGRGRDCGED